MKFRQVAQWAEIGASLAVVVSLVFLIREVRHNTQVIERQAILDRAEAINHPFLGESKLPAILTKIKEVDGHDPWEQAFMDRYGLTHPEAVRWGRHLSLMWVGFEADYRLEGESQSLERIVRIMLTFPDNQLFWDMGAPQVSNPEFRAYVEDLRRSTSAE